MYSINHSIALPAHLTYKSTFSLSEKGLVVLSKLAPERIWAASEYCSASMYFENNASRRMKSASSNEEIFCFIAPKTCNAISQNLSVARFWIALAKYINVTFVTFSIDKE